MTSTCPTGASPSPGTPGELTYRALRAWLGHRRTAWPRTPNRHVLISGKTALGTEPVSKSYINCQLRRHGVSVERIRRDRVLHEALTAGPDPLWITPSLVETRFSPDALVWVTVVFHGTAAWRNHGLIIFPLVFYRTSVQLRCPVVPPGGGLRPARPPSGAWASPRRAPWLCAAGSPGRSRVTRSVIACDAGGALDLGGGSAAPLTRPTRRYPPAGVPAVTSGGISEEGRGPGQRPGGCGRSPPG